MIPNPFYHPIREDTKEERTRPDVFYVVTPSVYSTLDFRDMLVLLKEEVIPTTMLESLGNNFTIHRCTKNIFGRYNFITVPQSTLKHFNHDNYQLRDEESVLFLFNYQPQHVHRFLEFNTFSYTMEDVIHNITMLDKVITGSPKYHKYNILRIVNVLGLVRDFDFWRSDQILKCNITQEFSKQYSDQKINDSNKDKYVESVVYQVKPKFADTHTYFKNRNIDLQLGGECGFNLVKAITYTQNDVLALLLFMLGLMSPRYCFQLFSQDISDEDYFRYRAKLQHLYQNYLGYIKYAFHYGWILYTFREGQKLSGRQVSNNISETDDCVFTDKSIALLPFFPYLPTLRSNPYTPIFISDNTIDCNKNILPPNIITKDDFHGISDVDSISNNLNFFLCKDSSLDVFQGMDMSKAVITGSFMAYAMPKNHFPYLNMDVNPLFGLDSADKVKFLDAYYKDSDLDIQTHFKTQIDFVKFCYELSKTVGSNLTSFFHKDPFIDMKTVARSYAVVVDPLYVEKVLKISIDEFNGKVKDDAILKPLYQLYCNYKKEEKNTSPDLKGAFWDSYFKPEPLKQNGEPAMKVIVHNADFQYDGCEEYLIRLSHFVDIVPGDDDPVVVRVGETVRYQIHSPLLYHPLEIYRVKKQNPFDVIANYHFNMVRSYLRISYNELGERIVRVYAMPSAITAYMSRMNTSTKYIVAKKKLSDIVKKAHSRGYGILFNSQTIRNIGYASVGPQEYSTQTFSLIPGDVKKHQNTARPEVYLREYYKRHTKNFSAYSVTKDAIKYSGCINPLDVNLMEQVVRNNLE